MAFTTLYGCGFEMGTLPIADADKSGTFISISSTYKKTGAYSLRIGSTLSNYARFRVAPGTLSDIYIGVWVHPGENWIGTTSADIHIIAYLADGESVSLRWNRNTKCWDAYISSSCVASGSVAVTNNWHHVQIHFNVGNTGAIQTIIEGITDIDYSGDTQPGISSAIEYIYLRAGGGAGQVSYIDDFVFGTGEWPGDRRADSALVPVADTAQKDWLPSSGNSNYAVVDEIPANDADYVYSNVNGARDLYEITDWNSTGKSPLSVVQWVRAKKNEASAHRIKLLLKSGATLSVGDAENLLTDWKYYSRIFDSNPATGSAWSDSEIDALQIGQESIIV